MSSRAIAPGTRPVTSSAGTRKEDGAYDHGRRDGLRLAIAVLASEEAKWAALLGESSSWRTNSIREVRHKTLQVAQKRVQTVLNRMSPRNDPEVEAEVKAALESLGL